jgi:CBS domain-containing protein/mannitol/fructose-specific phosphotransferase system IIA component (Ntr-type)
VGILLRELLPAEQIVVPLEASTFRDAVSQMLLVLERLRLVRNLPLIEKAFAGVRGKDVVSIGEHVALPHFRTDAVDQLVLALGISRTPLDVSDTTLAGSPRLIALVLAPPEAATRYLQTVAALARLFRDPSVVDRVAAASSAHEVLALPELNEARVQPDLLVRDVMAHRTEGIAPTRTVREALDLMLLRGWRSLAVIGDRGEVLGILTEREVMRVLLPEIPRAGEAPQENPEQGARVLVREAMSRTVICVSEEMGLQEAANLMVNKNVEQVPVVHDAALTGMLSRSDLIRKLFGR